jgi:hypothetical protein
MTRNDRIGRIIPVAALALLGAAACGAGLDGKAVRPPPEPISEDVEIAVPADAASAVEPSSAALSEASRSRLTEATHVSISVLAAQKWGLSPGRVSVLGDAADDPDTYEAGLANGYNQQWSHAYLYSPLGFWIWGDANENFDDCITGRLAGQIEGPECKDGQSAKQWYQAGDQVMGDAFLGYATHYIEDASMILHASFPSADMLTQHFAYESWVQANWTAGYNFSAVVAADNYYYPITDLQQAVRNTAWAASYWNSSSAGRKAWDAYRASGYPTAANTGNADLVANTQVMLIRASRYTLGAIKYGLDTYGQWSSQY